MYNSNLTNLNNITGGQIGAYFGYSVASGDLNGDGLDDVIGESNFLVQNFATRGHLSVSLMFAFSSLISDHKKLR